MPVSPTLYASIPDSKAYGTKMIKALNEVKTILGKQGLTWEWPAAGTFSAAGSRLSLQDNSLLDQFHYKLNDGSFGDWVQLLNGMHADMRNLENGERLSSENIQETERPARLVIGKIDDFVKSLEAGAAKLAKEAEDHTKFTDAVRAQKRAEGVKAGKLADALSPILPKLEFFVEKKGKNGKKNDYRPKLVPLPAKNDVGGRAVGGNGKVKREGRGRNEDGDHRPNFDEGGLREEY